MIPRQICLDGFMSYRQEMTISFRGASIWALAGDNGSGKSTLFDAMFYALYGEHRLGSQGAQQLIHHERDSLRVEFDFAIGEDEYRIRRTLTRKASNNRTVQALYMRGPNAPDPGSAGPQPIAETHKESGLRNWVKQVVGLDSQAFTFSVWLQQGRSDALINASPKERHHMLTQIIDLSAYERLWQRADAAYRQWDAQAGVTEQHLLQLEESEESRLETVKAREQQAQLAKQAVQERHLCLAGWRVQAQRWQQVGLEWQNQHQALLGCEELLAHASQIEQDAKRSDLLRTVLPLLQGISEKRLACDRLMALLELLEQKRKEQEQLKDQVKEAHEGQQRAVETQKSMSRQMQELLKVAQQRLDDMEPAIREVNILDTLRKQASTLEQQLSTIDPALSDHYQRLQQELNEVQALLAVLPWLRQFVAARKQWQHCGEELALLAVHQQESEAQLKQSQQEIEVLGAQIEDIKEQERLAQQEVIRVEMLVKQDEQREEKFREIDGKATCSYCGQMLTPEHLESERQKVVHNLQQTRILLHQMQERAQLLQRQWKKEQRLLQKKQAAYLEMERGQKARHGRWMLLNSQKSQAEVSAEAGLQQVPASFRRTFWERENAENYLQICLQATSPSAEDLVALEQRANCKDALASQLSCLQSTLDQRQSLLTQWEYVSHQQAQGEQLFPVAQQAALREEYRQAQQERSTLTDQLEAVSQSLQQREQDLQCQGARLRDCEQSLGALTQRIAVAQRDFENAVAFIREKEAEFPSDWRQPAAELSQKSIKLWKQESEVLREASKRLERLVAARQVQQSYRQRLAEIDAERERTPVEARRSLEEIDQEVAHVTIEYTYYEQEHQRMQQEKSYLEGVCEQRRLWKQQYKEAKQKALLYKELSRLLGADCLQRYLLQKAERGIVNAANEFLDHISGGTLRLELGEEADQGTKALDLLAYHQCISATAVQPVKLLSGSQQFRVAVSLALGIGTYAGGGAQRVEAVMIDEGFGSLDVKGRRDMIQVIQDLKDVLKCIIVVSHQAEFFEEFDNQYYVRLVDGSTIVSLC